MKIVKRLILIVILIVIIISTVVLLQGYKMYTDAINEINIEDKISSIRSKENYTTMDNLPKDYTNAVVSVEDHRFYDHGAIDIISIGRAIFTNIRKLDLAEGGSTITQQLSKNIYFSNEQSFLRKISEIFVSFDLENKYSKDEILELYVNTSYFGDGYYCIKDASLGYFDKEPKDMNLYESTLIAGVPNAPSAYAPTKNLNLSELRQKHVIKTMVENNYLTQEQADNINRDM